MRMRVRILPLAASSLTLLLALACANPVTLKPGKPHVIDVPIDLPRDRVFPTIVTVMHGEQYDVIVVEQNLGVLRLEPKVFEGPVMDNYCLFPAVYTKTGMRVSTFTEYHQDRLKQGKQGITGRVALNYLVTDRQDGGTNVNLRSAWEVTNGEQMVACESTGRLEEGLIDAIKAQLLAPSA